LFEKCVFLIVFFQAGSHQMFCIWPYTKHFYLVESRGFENHLFVDRELVFLMGFFHELFSRPPEAAIRQFYVSCSKKMVFIGSHQMICIWPYTTISFELSHGLTHANVVRTNRFLFGGGSRLLFLILLILWNPKMGSSSGLIESSPLREGGYDEPFDLDSFLVTQ
jgi:hypothetical protein